MFYRCYHGHCLSQPRGYSFLRNNPPPPANASDDINLFFFKFVLIISISLFSSVLPKYGTKSIDQFSVMVITFKLLTPEGTIIFETTNTVIEFFKYALEGVASSISKLQDTLSF